MKDKDKLDAIDLYLIDQYTEYNYRQWDTEDIQKLRLDAMGLFQVFISVGYIKTLLELPA